MAKISQRTFSWKELEEKNDLERLKLTLNYLPDEELMNALEEERKNGRNDYPIRALWNSIIAGIVFQHSSINSLIRELNRNPALKEICGFEPFQKIPKNYVYSRFCKKLYRHYDLVEKIFSQLVFKVQKDLADFGKNISGDGKAVKSLAFPNKNNHDLKPDVREINRFGFLPLDLQKYILSRLDPLDFFAFGLTSQMKHPVKVRPVLFQHVCVQFCSWFQSAGLCCCRAMQAVH